MRYDFDWEAIERDYRTGSYSMRELARKHGYTTEGDPSNTGPSPQAIGKRARKKFWSKDLSKDVQARAAAKLLAGSGGRISDEEAVERAASTQAEILRKQRENATQLREQAELLMRLATRRGASLEEQKWPASAEQLDKYADLLNKAERAMTRAQEAERALLDLSLPSNGEQGVFDEFPGFTHEGRRRAVADLMFSEAESEV